MEKAYYNGKIYTAKEITEYLQENKLIRIASRNGEFKCIDPECTHPKLKYNSGPKKGKYFSHYKQGYCGYDEYYKKLTGNIKKLRELICKKICENINAEFQTDQLLTPRHYTPLVIILENGTKLAIDIEENKYPTEIHKLAKSYQELNIHNQWVIIGNPYTDKKELDIKPLERHQLHETVNNAVIIVSPKLDEFLTVMLDTESYMYNGKEVEMEGFSKLFTKVKNISELAIVNNQLLYEDALTDFVNWKEAKKKAFIKRTTPAEPIAPPKYEISKPKKREFIKRPTSTEPIVPPKHDISICNSNIKKPAIPKPKNTASMLSQNELNQISISLEDPNKITRYNDIRYVICEKCLEIKTIEECFLYRIQMGQLNKGICRICKKITP